MTIKPYTIKREVTMAVYGYVRISTNSQEGDNQKHGVLAFANEKNLGKIVFTEETVSGKIDWKKRELGNLIDRMKAGDVLIVSELSRLGRSMLECMELLSILTRKEVKVYAVKGNWEIGNGLQSKIIAFAFSLAAEIERELISSRTKEALARLKSEGRKLGRPVGTLGVSKLTGKEDEIKMLLGHKVAKAAIARMMHVSRPALYDFIESRKLGR